MPARLPSFWLKVALAVAVVAAADALLFEAKGLGANLGVLLTAGTLALALANPASRRHPLSATALGGALLLALLPFERPSLVGFLLWSVAMAVAALAPRARPGDDGWPWAQRLLLGGLKALVGPLTDVRHLLKVRAWSRPRKVTAVLLGAALPIAGGLGFLALFAAANPVIEDAFGRLQLPAFDPGRLVFWCVVGLPLWAVLRPRGLRRTLRTPGLDGDLDIPGVTAASVTASLVVFNAVFALQNGLDIAFLWTGAELPDGVSFAAYAHKGAYPLIATALLAGLFVLAFLRPGSATAAQPVVRWLVIIWVAQNVFLVASTALRTIDYIEVYSLTRMRIAALLWMALVAAGLLLILWRVLRARSSGWLINANLAVLGVAMIACSIVDFSAITAAWNVRHAREAGGRGVALDLCYMRSLKGGAVVPLAELESRLPDGEFQRRVEVVRTELVHGVARGADGLTYRLRDARRLQRLAALGYPAPSARQADAQVAAHRCDGLPIPAARPVAPPLTPNANPRT